MFIVKDKNGNRIGESVQFLTFEIELDGRRLHLALNIQKIKEVVEFKKLDSVPDAQKYFHGILELRGEPVSVLNVEAIINKDSQRTSASSIAPTRVVICDLQGIWLGIPVLSTGRILNCSSSDFLPPPTAMVGTEQVYFSGILNSESGFISVFDIDGIIHSIGLGADLKPGPKPSSHSGKRVLIVEDSRAIRAKLVQFFENIGFSTKSAQNGAEGLSLAAQEDYRFDLIFTDIEMPVLDGIAMARTIRQSPLGARIPVIFNSALSNPHLIHDVTQERLGTYVVKFNVEAIMKAIDELLTPETKPTVAKAA